ncbi:hypothetical protein JTE90_023654 [Oedothorax gibbosus]|uniref:RNA 3'-terminal phosphate cyclase n=1 Tax=Oedothorax gibbosus TaxID=931172 RepID=A0AAV6UYJ7_9ARAC|nr:hypothetical protein JTE90_023654 [Oedothorax gibbosus]
MLHLFLAIELIIFMALAKGKSRVRVGAPTLHTKTAIKVAEMMTNAKFTISQDETNDSWVIECDGIGLERYYEKL